MWEPARERLVFIYIRPTSVHGCPSHAISQRGRTSAPVFGLSQYLLASRIATSANRAHGVRSIVRQLGQQVRGQRAAPQSASPRWVSCRCQS
eukprot:scaffold17151_cov81-Phaeocystis_antarctica.AAC.6